MGQSSVGISVPGQRILLVEDEEMIRATLAEILDEEGFGVTEAASGDAAPALAAELGPFDALFTDMHMPGDADGLQLAEALRRLLADG